MEGGSAHRESCVQLDFHRSFCFLCDLFSSNVTGDVNPSSGKKERKNKNDQQKLTQLNFQRSFLVHSRIMHERINFIFHLLVKQQLFLWPSAKCKFLVTNFRCLIKLRVVLETVSKQFYKRGETQFNLNLECIFLRANENVYFDYPTTAYLIAIIRFLLHIISV